MWGNPTTISNLNCLFSMHNCNWWVNLSKMTGFNISLSLNERQSSSDKKHNISLRLVLFIPFRCCFAGSPPFSLSTVKQRKLFHYISKMFFTFLAKNTFWVKLFSLNVCEAALQAAIGSLRIDDFRTTTPLDCVTGLQRMLIWALAGVAPKSTPLSTAIRRRPRKSRTWD